MASKGAATMEVEVTTAAATRGRAAACQRPRNRPSFCASPSLALNFSDTETHDGRAVGVNASALVDSLGYRPKLAHVRHSSGTRYEVPISYSGGLATWRIHGFSSNTVTFDGAVNLSSPSATNGATMQYDLQNLDAASGPTGTFTGVESTEWDNVSASSLGNGDTLATNVAGTQAPRGPNAGEPEVVFTGDTAVTSRTASGTASGGETPSLTLTGNIAPAGPSANGKPTLELVGRAKSQGNGTDLSNGGAHDYANPPTTITEVEVEVGNPTCCAANGEVYLITGGQNYSIGSFSSVHSATKTFTGTWETNGGDATVKLVSEYLTLERTRIVGQAPESVSVSADDGTSASFSSFSKGETKTKEFAMSESASPLSFSVTEGRVEWTLNYTDRTASESPEVDVDGDGTPEASVSGILSDGETATYQVASLGLTDDSATVSTVNGSSVGVAINLQEVTGTRDATVTVNGQQVGSVSGTLGDGETHTFSANASVLQNGTNTVEIGVGDGSLSADAPTPTVGVQMNHTAAFDQSVQYDGEKFSERYNVSRTWGDATTNATLTIPFEGNVIGNRELRVYINGTETGPTFSRFSNTTLTVGLGDLEPGTETRVMAVGSKVSVANGAIQVLKPTDPGADLDSKIEVTSRNASEPLTIAFGGTTDADRIHYTVNESYAGADEYHLATATGDRELHLTEAADGSTFRIRTLPVKAVPQSGEVELAVSDASVTEPTFHVEPGRSGGDKVRYTFLNAKDNTKYLLYSQDYEKVLDSGTANSPLTLTDDDDNADTLQFRVEESDGGGGNDGGGGSGFWGDGRSAVEQATQTVTPLMNPGIVALLMIGLLAVTVWYTDEELHSTKPVYKRPLVLLAVPVSFGIGIFLLDPRSITKPVQLMLQAALPLAGVLSVLAGGYLVYSWRQKQVADANTPDSVVKLGGKRIAGTETDDSSDDTSSGWGWP